MADSKITALIATTTALGTDIIQVIDGIAAATPANKKMTLTNLISTLVALGSLIQANVSRAFTVGYSHTVSDQGTKSAGTYTPSELNGYVQKISNAGAFTLAPPVNTTTIDVIMTMASGFGAVTVSGFGNVDGDTAALAAAAIGDVFILSVRRRDTKLFLSIKKAL